MIFLLGSAGLVHPSHFTDEETEAQRREESFRGHIPSGDQAGKAGWGPGWRVAWPWDLKAAVQSWPGFGTLPMWNGGLAPFSEVAACPCPWSPSPWRNVSWWAGRGPLHPWPWPRQPRQDLTKELKGSLERGLPSGHHYHTCVEQGFPVTWGRPVKPGLSNIWADSASISWVWPLYLGQEKEKTQFLGSVTYSLAQNNPLYMKRLQNNARQQRLSPRWVAQTATEMWWGAVVMKTACYLVKNLAWSPCIVWGLLLTTQRFGQIALSPIALSSFAQREKAGHLDPILLVWWVWPHVARKGCHLGLSFQNRGGQGVNGSSWRVPEREAGRIIYLPKRSISKGERGCY